MTADLTRFVSAQDTNGTYHQALKELEAGRKESHWMWFVFPQIAGLGRSTTAQLYAISSLAEAADYLAHPILGPRLQAVCESLAELREDNPDRIFGPVDAQKLRSSMTLFLRADPERQIFQQVLDQYFGGAPDPATDRELARLARE